MIRMNLIKCRLVHLLLLNFVIVLVLPSGSIRAAVIAPEWADVRFNPCAKVSNIFNFHLKTF